ncbi:guanylate kinase [Paenibacillus marchantiophytorum]|uniref:Guanylate kinase n=1 Tax=Paenibacillus marchantiophytorum TaxID=1619310 RepID=A0ABQ1F4V7_9BACL|nr:guanylate kinase [Paenibacillus marchantiophytorum]GFZ99134.1 guanylate kinase [Paenibacillus marchantiophytorum]
MSSHDNGLVFVFTGTSGSGRKTIAHRIAQELGFSSVVSYTTRTPRPKEINGKDYNFTTRNAFIESDIAGEFFQTAEIDGNFYGIKKADIDESLRKNGMIYVIVNRYAANRFKYIYGERAVRLFIYVNKQTIMERLLAHNTSTDVIDHYMNHYIEEVSYRKDCEHVFENMDLQETINKVKATMLAHIPTTTS